LTVQLVSLTEIQDAMEDMQFELYNISRTSDRPPMKVIPTWLSINNVRLELELSEFMELQKLQDAHRSKTLSLEDQWLLELMPPTGMPMHLESSIIVMLSSTMPYSWLELLKIIGLSRTLGVQHGDNKVILDLKRVTLAEYAQAHHSQSD